MNLDLPIAIPWQEIAVSPDMIDTEFCNKRFPATWRSSLALSIYEPPADELSDDLCGQRLTYLKVTCTITGYQPSGKESDVVFDDVPAEALDRLLSEYWACYGVLLNVAVFPHPSTRALMVLRDRIDFTGLETDDAGVLPNPLVIRDVSFEAADRPANRFTEAVAESGDDIPELDLQNRMLITLPAPADRVVIRIVRATAGPMFLTAFRGEEIVAEVTVDAALTEHVVNVAGLDIDRLVLLAAENDASITELSYFTATRAEVRVSEYPHIIDVEPKVRDLYQASTESGEILSSSASAVKTDKSMTSAEQTETGFKLGAKMPIGPGATPGGEMSGEFERKRTEREESTWSVAVDASRERRETQGTSTQLSQMYNLLTAYHVGTNRAAFLMLPRPHVLQPTDHRTFIQGLRYIEGIQEFLLIVSRPSDVEGLSIEAALDTGHFPEDVDITEPEEEFDEGHEDFFVLAQSGDDDSRGIDEFPTSVYTIESGSGWVIDRRLSRIGALGDPGNDGWDPGHPGLKDLDSGVVDAGPADLTDDGTLRFDGQDAVVLYNYQPTTDTTVAINGRVMPLQLAEGLVDTVRHWRRRFRVFTRSVTPKPSSAGASVATDFLITSRGLCVRVLSGDPCPRVVPPPRDFDPGDEWVVSEDPLLITNAVLRRSVTSQGRGPALREVLRKIQGKLITSGQLRTRYPNRTVGFLDTDYVAKRLRGQLSDDALARPVSDVEGLPAAIVSGLGHGATVQDALRVPLPELARRTGTTAGEAARARRRLLGENLTRE